MDLRFICDRNLGKLVKWLRILGYDTLWHRSDADQCFLADAGRQGRIVLTRIRNLGIGRSVRIIEVRADRVEDQIYEIMEALVLRPDPRARMTLCLQCNAKLEAIQESEAKGVVPDHVHQNNKYFKKCPICKKIYWPGTHAKNMLKMLKTRIPNRLL